MHPSLASELPLVGREPELAILKQAIDDARHARSTVIHLIGGAGLGKSRLLAEARRLAQGARASILFGAATDPAGLAPFATVRSAFEAVGEGRGEDSEGSGRGLGRRLGLPPEDVAVVIDVDRVDVSVRRWRDLMRRATTNLAARGPVLVAFDDVHWADEQSLDVLTSLARRPPLSGFVLLLGYRWRPGLASLLAASSDLAASTPSFSVRRLELSPLDAHDLEKLLPHTGSARRQALLRASGGNPFFVDALHRHPLAPGTGLDESLEIPGPVLAALVAELDRLDTCDRRIVDVAAVLGITFDGYLVADVAGTAVDAALTALERAVDEGLCAHEPGTSSWTFRHPLLRVAAYEAQSVTTRLATHHRVQEVLSLQGASASERARHVAVTARSGDRVAADLLVTAAGDVVDRSPATAERWLTRALRLRPDAGAHDLREVRLTRCRANTALGRLQEARAEAHDVASSFGHDDSRRVDAVRFAAHLDQLLGRHAESDALLTRALESSGHRLTDDIALLVDLATTRLMRGDFERARGPAERAVSLATGLAQTDARGLVAASLSLHALVALTDGDHGRALADREAAGSAVDALTDAELARHLEAGLWLGWVEMFVEEYAAGARHLLRCLDIARRGTHQHLLTHLLVGFGSVAKLRGDLPSAAEAFDEAAEVALGTRSGELLGMAQAMQCRAATWLGDHDRARLLGERAVAATAEGGSWFEAVARALLAQARLMAGDTEGVVAAVLDAGGGPELPRFDPASRCDWWEVVTRAAIADGDLQRAADFTERAVATSAALPLRAPRGAAALARAQLALAAEQWQVAAEAARDSAGHFAAVGNRLELGRASLTLGSALVGMGDRRAALDATELAEVEFAACSAAHLQASGRALMRRLGRRVPGVPRPRSGSVRRAAEAPELPSARPSPWQPSAGEDLSTLSKREWEVASLVRAGYTNRRIAAELVVSEKTVESHLSHIFTKLGVDSRSAVAAAVAAHARP